MRCHLPESDDEAWKQIVAEDPDIVEMLQESGTSKEEYIKAYRDVGERMRLLCQDESVMHSINKSFVEKMTVIAGRTMEHVRR